MALFTLFAIHILLTIKINYIEPTIYLEYENPSFSEYDEGSFEEYKVFPRFGLYGFADKVKLLQAYELEENIYNSTTAWLVQFYDPREDPPVTVSKNFSTFWKQFAASIHHWQDVIKVGVFDCLDDSTTDFQLCEKYKAWGISSMRYYPPFLKSFNIGERVRAPREDGSPLAPAWRAELIKHIQNTKRKPFYWPDLSPLSSEDAIESIWAAHNGQLLVLVVETAESYVGCELILDLNGADVVVRYTNNMEFANPKEKLPQILVIRPDIGNSRKQVHLTSTTRPAIYQAVRSHLQKEGFYIPNIVFDTQLDEDRSLSPQTFPEPFKKCETILTKNKLGIFEQLIDKNDCEKIREFRLTHPILSRLILPELPF